MYKVSSRWRRLGYRHERMCTTFSKRAHQHRLHSTAQIPHGRFRAHRVYSADFATRRRKAQILGCVAPVL
ncbi:hypothetical protein CMEL01_06104 [Colletotrichum melonis]|uniref:Uncharacterized protein n=1 Tax=Colletotrichum melonis TaxID=1209925 RepID=A0AAI9U840_9PEZI|nr:hypothetical protein CMEL01_06104 [Colletotrichum melonis]